ncbi:MAG: hypothetical protein IJ362_10075, partial [Oscillospiraceae bacterium]|nr:hypothetical protein [Oscillospiraceae bacterium]
IAIHWPRKDKLGLLSAAKPFLQLRCPTFLVTFAPKVTPAQRKKESVVTQEQRFFACGSE